MNIDDYSQVKSCQPMTIKHLSHIIEQQKQREENRRALTGISGKLLSLSKQVIFKLQRNDHDDAANGLKQAHGIFLEGSALCKKDFGLLHEGVWRAAQEEYCEALLVSSVLVGGKLVLKSLPTNDPEILIGGLSDLTGELARFAVIKATEHDHETVERLYVISQEVVEMLTQMDLTGSLRSKFDQAKQHVRKLEDIRYQLSLRV